VLEAQLRRIINVLILAAAALREVLAFRFDAFWRGGYDTRQLRPRKILFDLGDFRLNHFTDNDERHEDDEIIQPPDTFPAKGEVVDGQGDFIRQFERHAFRLGILPDGKSLFTRPRSERRGK